MTTSNIETTRNVLRRFGGGETTVDAVLRVEKHDDLYPGMIDSYVGGIVARVLPQLFYEYLKDWPTVKVQQDYPAMMDGKIVYQVNVEYDGNWTDGEKVDFTVYKTDKFAFCAILDSFVQRVANRLEAEKESGRAWWRDMNYIARCKIDDKLYSLTTTLAEIKPRGNRFQWSLRPGEMRTDWPVKKHKQGHSNTLEEAKAIVENAWHDCI
jgi:hypothetical protein